MLNIYRASAGSGKTYHLVRTYIELLLKGRIRHPNFHQSILAITFTNKATTEMKERVLTQLHRLSVNAGESPYCSFLKQELHCDEMKLEYLTKQCLTDILQDYSHFAIMTVDSFFQFILRHFFRELNLVPSYDISLDTDRLIIEATDKVLYNLNKEEVTDLSFKWLVDYVTERIEQGKRWDPREEIKKLSNDILKERLQTLLLSNESFFVEKSRLADFKEMLLQLVKVKDSVKYKKKAEYDEDKRKGYTAESVLSHINELGLLINVVEELREENIRHHRIPIAQVGALISGIIDNSDTPFIYEKVGTFFSHFLLDEFQDTSVLQWANLMPLVKESNDNGNTNLIVGDVKQCIYRWRNSNWHILSDVSGQISPNTTYTLDVNYRSTITLCQFFNSFFPAYQHLLLSVGRVSNAKLFQTTIDGAYADLTQEAFRSDKIGRVVIHCVDDGDFNEKQDEAALSFLLESLEECKRNAIPLNKVAVIVRWNKEVAFLCSFLLQQGYEVESVEGLQIQYHPAVQFLISILRLQVDEGDTMSYEHIRKVLERELSEEDKLFIDKALHRDLYSAVQGIIAHFDLLSLENASLYVTSFQNLIFLFLSSYSSDIYEFLSYWEKHQDSITIPCISSSEAVQIMTIHKAKGLEFDTVIMPFTDWSLDVEKGSGRDFIWCKSNIIPFNCLSAIPLSLNKSLLKTYFKDDYESEIVELAMDSLNLLYVGFTRAKEQLYVSCRTMDKEKDELKNAKTVGHLIAYLFKNKIDITSHKFIIGGSQRRDRDGDVGDDIETMEIPYRVAPIGSRLFLRYADASLQDGEDSMLTKGNIMHRWLSLIKSREDVDVAWSQIVREGLVSEQDKEPLYATMSDFWELVSPYKWFERSLDVKCEETIITPSGKFFRPDRLIIDEKKRFAVVVDYKFGNIESQLHQQQVKHYKMLLREMGFTVVEAFIVYVSLKKTVKVDD